jgi:hypothetical protein
MIWYNVDLFDRDRYIADVVDLDVSKFMANFLSFLSLCSFFFGERIISVRKSIIQI